MKKIAVFIDCENINASHVSFVIRTLKEKGDIINIQAINDWSDTQNGWDKEVCKQYAIEPICIFKYQKLKNTCDMRLQRAVFECIQANVANCIAIVSSDSDFMDLTIYMRKCGIYTIGFGEAKTLDTLKNSYNEFIELNNIQTKTLKNTHDKSIEPSNKNTSNQNIDSNRLNILVKALKNTKDNDTNAWKSISMVVASLKTMNPQYTKSFFGIGSSSSWKKVFDSYPQSFEVRYKDSKKTILEIRLKNS